MRDCNGDYFGSASIDVCGRCVGGRTSNSENQDKDCAGVCFGKSNIIHAGSSVLCACQPAYGM